MKRLERILIVLTICAMFACSTALAEVDPESADFSLAGSAYGVTAADEIRMGTALVQVTEGANAQLWGMDEILAGAEFSALEALSPAERALVALSVMGHTDEIENAVTELNIEISEDAQLLMSNITERLSGMSEEDWAEFEGLLERYFSVVEDNGVILLQITLIAEDGQLLRMSFTPSEEIWWLSEIDTAE